MSISNYAIMVPNSDYTPGVDNFIQKLLVDKFKLGQCGQVVLRSGCCNVVQGNSSNDKGHRISR